MSKKKKREKNKSTNERDEKVKDYDVCEFWRFYKQKKNREEDNHQKNGGHARSFCAVSYGC